MKASQKAALEDRKPQGIIVLVDVAIFTLTEKGLCVLVHQRDKAPFAGSMALPGGYIRPGEDDSALAAARRVLKDKIGVHSPYLEQLATYTGADRDPGGWSASVAHFALVPLTLINAADMRGQWLPARGVLQLAFDHNVIVRDAVERLRNKSAYSTLPIYLAGEQFTLPQLQGIYEQVLDEPINKVSFRRRMEEHDVIEPIEEATVQNGRMRPAQLYRVKPKYRDQLAIITRGFGGR